ncbi:DUF5928 domain-containing protein [Paracoccus sp. (in: a-proteobacteria)]|uniref:DUF5928 domain-containing protein n=1 Tax=Paracoccus sp. TaxID=267 RepID=UPI003A882472
MARIAFILLTHKDPAGLIEQARRLTGPGDYVAIHYDARAPRQDYDMLRQALSGENRIVFAARRYKCGWGEWSLVAATLAALEAAQEAFPDATHFYMLSGDCMPIKSAEYVHDYLDRDDCDYIESVDFFDGGWIKTGIIRERLIYRHWFNERTQKRLFYWSMRLQRRLRLHRNIPSGLQMMIGSQWWCLRRETTERIMALLKERRDILTFFRTTWIPDETFFQTLVAHLVPRAQIRSRTLTFLIFSDYGMPVTFYNDHYDLLLRQDCLFARKISGEAQELRERLGALWQESGHRFPISNEGKRVQSFLTGRGRVGRRFAPRFWEDEAGLSRGTVVHLIVAKKWHMAKRLTARIREKTRIPAVDYLFNEYDAGLPDLGGAASTMAKRQNHRRALLHLLFDAFGAQQLVMCVDPSALSLITDFSKDRAETRILLIDTDFNEDYLRGHLRRIGLIGDGSPEAEIQTLIPVMRDDLQQEVERLHEVGFSQFGVISGRHPVWQNAAALAGFLDISDEIAHDLAETPHLFSD